MARQEIDIGVEGNDGTGDSIRESMRKVNENFQEIYAVVGKGGQITFTLLSDTPDDLAPFQGNGQTAYIPIVKQDGSGIEIRRLVSNNFDTSGEDNDTVSFDVSKDGVVVIKTTGVDISQDSTPELGGPLNAGGVVIANIDTSAAGVAQWNLSYDPDITQDDVVIDKKFADANYIRRLLPSETVSIPDEPIDASGYTKTFGISQAGYASIPGHGLTRGSDTSEWIYETGGTPVSYLLQ